MEKSMMGQGSGVKQAYLIANSVLQSDFEAKPDHVLSDRSVVDHVQYLSSLYRNFQVLR